MTSPPPIPLAYEKPPRGRRWGRRWVIGIGLGVAALVAWQRGPGLWLDIVHRYYRHKCDIYSVSADQVVYQEDPVKTAAAYPQPAGRRYLPTLVRQPFTAIDASPDCWRGFTSYWNGATPARVTPVLFLHERSMPSGRRYLVCLYFGGWTLFNWYFRAIMFGTHSDSHSSMTMLGKDPDGLGIAPGLLTFYAGQPDPADASHFTIGYASNGQSGVIDGYLNDQGDISLKVRDGPAKNR